MTVDAGASHEEAPSPTVLVVDDDRDFADTCEYWLRGSHYEVVTVYDGESAVETVDESVDVALLDRRMPGMSGDEVLDYIREQDLGCRVAMLTAVEPDTDIIEMPFDEYLVKPVTRSETQETVADLLARGSFEEEVQDHLAREATERVLSSKDGEEFEASHVDVPEERAELLERRHRDIERLTRLNEVIRDVDRAIVETDGRDDLERAVCESLVDTDPYLAAVAIEHSPATDTLTTGTAGGVDVDEVDLDAFREVIREALTDSEVVVHSALTDDQHESLFTADVDREDATVGVIPITYRDTTYGVLLVGAADSHVFTEREIEVFTDLGRTIGNGLNAVAQKRLLGSDSLVELEFRHADSTDPFVAVARQQGCTLELEGFAPAADGSVTCFVAASGASADDIMSVAVQSSSVTGVRVVAESPSESLLEWDVDDGCVVHTLVNFGANVRSLDIADGTGNVVAAVASDANFSAVVDAVTTTFPDVDLEAKREVDRSVRTTGGFGDDVDDRVTDRQRDVLEAAFASGYFQWPRESTAEEVAESLDISPPTFHEHLRTAHRKLLEAYLEQEKRQPDVETEPKSELT